MHTDRCLDYRTFVIREVLGETRIITPKNIPRLIIEIQAQFPNCSSLEAVTSHLKLCPVPLTRDPELHKIFALEQAWETYGTPPIAGGQLDQPEWLLEACEAIRATRNTYRAKHLGKFVEEMKGKKRRQR